MAIVNISSTLDGEATVASDATATYAADSTQAGSSIQTADAVVDYDVNASFAGTSNQVATADLALAADATLAGSSNQTSDATASYGATTILAGESTIALDADQESRPTADMPGTSDLQSEASVVLVADVDASGGSTLTAEALMTADNSLAAAGSSGMSAAASVIYRGTTLMAAGSSASISANYAMLDITCEMSGTSEISGDATFLGAFGEDSYGGSPYGGAYPPYGLESAIALSSTQVRIRYTAMFDAGFPLLLAISNYSISPPVGINSIVLESAQSVLLNTTALTAPVYTVTISDALGYFGQPLDPALDSAQFSGVATEPTFYAVATRKNRVRVVFSVPMLGNASLTDPAQYVLTDLSGGAISISTVTTEQLSDVRSTVLLLGEDLVDERHYRVTVLSGIVSQDLAPVSPDTAVFQWVENALQTQIPVGEFSGEVLHGLYGIHGGLVFFSPALETAASNSIIQVEEVDVCTRAYDEYHLPQPIDPRPLMTHGAGVVPTPVVTVLNSSESVLWASFPRLVDARFELGMTTLGETVPRPVDGPAAATLTETWPANRVALLNNTGWKLFDNLGNPPAYFITADNLTPFPPGASVITILSLTMAGEAMQEADADAL